MTIEMKPHFRKTVEEIDADILNLESDVQALRGVRAVLVKLYGGTSDLPEPAAPKKRGEAKPQPPAAGAPETSGRATAEGIKIMAFVRSAPEPFSSVSVGIGAGVESKTAGNYLQRWLVKGYLQKVGRGSFQRTATFPAAA